MRKIFGKAAATALVITLSLLLTCQTGADSPSNNLFNYTSAFSMTDTNEFIWVSAAAYCNPTWLENFQCGSVCNNLPGYQYYNSYTVEADYFDTLQYIMIYDEEAQRFFVSFEGTRNAVQFLKEIFEGVPVNYTLHPIDGAVVEGYFYNEYVNNVRTTFLSMMQDAVANFSNYTFIFTSHSLGAALVTLAGHDAILSGLLTSENTLLYTFGQPRTGNPQYAFSVDQSFGAVYRVVHYRDVVPHMPPCSWSGNCVMGQNVLLPGGEWQPWHNGVQIWFDDENSTSYVTCTANYGEDPSCSDSVPFEDWSLSDHLTYFGINVGLVCSEDNESEDDDLSEYFEDFMEAIHYIE